MKRIERQAYFLAFAAALRLAGLALAGYYRVLRAGAAGGGAAPRERPA